MEWLLETIDTVIKIQAGDRCPVLYGLSDAKGYDWLPKPSELLLPRRLAHGGDKIPVAWNYTGYKWNEREHNRQLTLTYQAMPYDVILDSIWSCKSGDGAVEHRMTITNGCNASIVVYSPQALDAEFFAGNDEVDVFYVSKDRLAPRIISFQRQYGTFSEPLSEDYHANIWTSVDGDDTGYIPLVMLHAGKKHGVYIGYDWNEGRIQVSGRQKNGGLYAGVEAGLHGDFCTEVRPGETFMVPGIFIGAFTGDIDDGSNRLRRWLFDNRMPERNRTDENIPYVQWNAFYNTAIEPGSWLCVEEKYYPMIDSVAKAGIEEVTIDVGWWETFGDYRGHSERWPKGMAAASKYAHDNNMLFTLYFAFLSGGSEDPMAFTGKGPNAHPEWITRNWCADMGIDACRDFMKEMILQRLNEYDVDTIRSDLSPITRIKSDKNPHQGCHDGPYWAQKGYIEFIDHLLENRPGLRYQNCNCGGALKGYALMKRSTAVQTTDIYTAIDVRQSIWDSSYCLPMMQLMTQFGDVCSGGKPPEHTPSYRFRSFLLAAPSAHFELPDEMNAEEAAVLKRLITQYKKRVRPLVRRGDVYHVLPRPDGHNWDGLELYDPDTGNGMLTVFRPDHEQAQIKVPLRGLDEKARYKIEYDDGTLPETEYSGIELVRAGVPVRLEAPFSAEWVFFTRQEST